MSADNALSPTAGYTVRDLARRYRVSPERVRTWIKRGELLAINTRDRCGRPRFVITPEALAAFERRRQVTTPPPKATRRKKSSGVIDFYPD
jgi:hypothetical protein